MGIFGAIGKGLSKVGKQVGGEVKDSMKAKGTTIKKKPFMSLIGAGSKMQQQKKIKPVGPGLAILLLLLIPTTARAQVTATPGNRLGWVQVGQAVSVAQGATYKAYIDVAAGVTVANHACAVGSPTTNAACTSDLPAMTPGAHAVTLTQVISTAESAKSSALNITFVVVVTPSSLQIVRLDEFPILDQAAHKLAVALSTSATPSPKYWKI